MASNNGTVNMLSEEQLKMIEQKRQKALELRAAAIARRTLQMKTESATIPSNLLNGRSCNPNEVLERNIQQSRTTGNGPIAPVHAESTAKPVAGISNGPRPTNCKCQAVCSVISRERFTVETGFHKGLVDIMKYVPGHAYVPKDRTWNFPLSEHDKLVQLTKPLVPEVRFVPLPSYVLQLFQHGNSSIPQVLDMDLSPIDAHLIDSLFPFQRDAICFAISKHGRVLIADDMGLGKTIEAMGIASYYRKDWPLLVVTPSSMRYSWLEAFHNWLPSVDPQSVTVVNTSKDPVGKVSVLIITYDLLAKKPDFLIRQHFNTVIVDESHLMKNFKTARTKALLPLLKEAKRVVLLSGTPALSRPAELYTQIAAINPKLFPSFQQFAYRYCNAKQMPWGLDTSGASNMKELHIILREHIMIRRLKSEVVSQLPPKRREMVILDPTKIPTNTKAMAFAAKHINEQGLCGMEKHGALLQYFHQTATAKLPAVCDYVIDLLEAGKKFICFAHHCEVLNGICNAITDRSKNMLFIRIDGSTPAEKRKLLCDKFQTSDQCRVAVLSITAASMGITLTAAQLVIFAELFWNPGILTQAEDRAHRIGQLDSVLVQYLIARGTSDDNLWPLVQEKLNILNKAGLSKDNFSDVDTKVLQCKSQSTIEDFFGSKACDWLNDIDWDDDGFGSQEQPSKKMKP